MKRRDENRQQSKEEFEAEFNGGDGDGTNPGEQAGSWVKANDEVIKKRKIMKAKRIGGGGGGVNTPFTGFQGGIINKEVSRADVI